MGGIWAQAQPPLDEAIPSQTSVDEQHTQAGTTMPNSTAASAAATSIGATSKVKTSAAAKSKAEKAKTLLQSAAFDTNVSHQHKLVGGGKYDRELLDAAEAFMADGAISQSEMKALIALACDGKAAKKLERDTLRYIMGKSRLTKKAKEELNKFLSTHQANSGKGYYVLVAGEKYDRALLELAEAQAKKHGKISLADAKALIEAAKDGKGITKIEQATLVYTLRHLQYSQDARAHLSSLLKLPKVQEASFVELRPAKRARQDSYYVQFDGVKYDRQLLEMAEAFAKRGLIDLAAAQQLLKEAKDGRGITACERQTLQYSLGTAKYSLPARKFLLKALL